MSRDSLFFLLSHLYNCYTWVGPNGTSNPSSMRDKIPVISQKVNLISHTNDIPFLRFKAQKNYNFEMSNMVN